jgi:putative ABC transport system permease protein
MNAGRRGSTSGGERHSLRNLLVVAQVAVASIALVFAGLLIRSLQHAEQVTLGFERHHIGVFDFDVGARRRSPEAKGQFLAAMLDTATTVPGVSSVALATSAPLSGSGSRTVLSEEQQGNPQVIGTTTALKYVTHDFFRTMGVSATEGRLFDRFDRDGAKRVAVVNEAMAQYFWPGRSPIGKRFLLRSIPGVYHEVVGVVPNSVLWELNEVPQPIGYIPLEQDPQTRLSLHVRAVGDPGPAVAAVMRHVQSLDPGLALTSLATIDSLLESRLWAWQAGASLFALFAGLCLLLASVGVSGALAHTVFLRTSEIGIRIALGSSLGHMQWSIVRDGVQLVIAGIAVGAAAAVALSAVIRSLLFGVAATDLTTYGAASGIVVIIGAGACWVAARRVLKIDPVRAIGGT